MVKISKELIGRAAQFMNVLGQYELDLNGYKITNIDNLKETKDLFNCINLSNNLIKNLNKIQGLKSLNTLILNNNQISEISSEFGDELIGLENLVLNRNNLTDINCINSLSSCKNLIRLSLIGNLVTNIKNYRLYTIYKIPCLRFLDFQKITLKEREAANELFKGKNIDTL